ncbi:hypothetical protein LN736_03360 [Clostridium sp. WLY-B-L2]|uniref:Uncharacterized protein n=1 Tax=Clostridium aromativorans TaxID=2836848 RepID=A0ABS8N413_9CLOT|nr:MULTISPECIES: hypothetical protein [Clostridium]KAA8675346.1 hypothetical protein F3O63_04770 [Clostridium sp. HV4-5-A1G]MCC9293909.1 hypothetical protein [Clostridium aromativorans]
MADEKVKWHPAFAAAVQLELKEYRKYLEFITEYQLTDEPLRIDVLVVKKLREIRIDKSLGRIFKIASESAAGQGFDEKLAGRIHR